MIKNVVEIFMKSEKHHIHTTVSKETYDTIKKLAADIIKGENI